MRTHPSPGKGQHRLDLAKSRNPPEPGTLLCQEHNLAELDGADLTELGLSHDESARFVALAKDHVAAVPMKPPAPAAKAKLPAPKAEKRKKVPPPPSGMYTAFSYMCHVRSTGKQEGPVVAGAGLSLSHTHTYSLSHSLTHTHTHTHTNTPSCCMRDSLVSSGLVGHLLTSGP